MRTNLSKKLLAAVLSLAMVLSLVGIQPSNANAASYKITKKAEMKAGKTVTYKVTGVKKTQYIKVTKKNANVTVKYNNKKVSTSKKIAGTGKALSLKVTAKEVNKDYTNKMTVKIYNKKNNKVVKTLTVSTKVLTQVKEEEPTPEEPTPEEPVVEQPTSATLTATGVKKLEVVFDKAVDTTVASLTVARGSVVPTIASSEWSEDGKTVVLTMAAKLSSGTYTVSLTGYKNTVEATTEVKDEKLTSYEISENLVETIAPAAGNSYQATATVSYTALNQYGEVMNDNNPQATSTFGSAVVTRGATINKAGLITVSTIGQTLAVQGTTGQVILVDRTTGTNKTAPVKYSAKSTAVELEVVGLYNASKAKFMDITANDSLSNYWLYFKAKNQYGESLTSSNIGTLNFSIAGGLTNVAVSSSTPVIADKTVKGEDYLAVQLSSATAAAGDFYVTIVNPTFGMLYQGTHTVAYDTYVASVNITANGNLYNGERNVLSYEILDQNGEEIKEYTKLNSLISFTGLPITWAKSSKGEGILRFTPTLSFTDGTNDKESTLVAGTITCNSVVPSKMVVKNLSFNVYEDRYVAAVTGLDKDAKTTCDKTSSINLCYGDVIFADQYGNELNGADASYILDLGGYPLYSAGFYNFGAFVLNNGTNFTVSTNTSEAVGKYAINVAPVSSYVGSTNVYLGMNADLSDTKYDYKFTFTTTNVGASELSDVKVASINDGYAFYAGTVGTVPDSDGNYGQCPTLTTSDIKVVANVGGALTTVPTSDYTISNQTSEDITTKDIYNGITSKKGTVTVVVSTEVNGKEVQTTLTEEFEYSVDASKVVDVFKNTQDARYNIKATGLVLDASDFVKNFGFVDQYGYEYLYDGATTKWFMDCENDFDASPAEYEVYNSGNDKLTTVEGGTIINMFTSAKYTVNVMSVKDLLSNSATATATAKFDGQHAAQLTFAKAAFYGVYVGIEIADTASATTANFIVDDGSTNVATAAAEEVVGISIEAGADNATRTGNGAFAAPTVKIYFLDGHTPVTVTDTTSFTQGAYTFDSFTGTLVEGDVSAAGSTGVVTVSNGHTGTCNLVYTFTPDGTTYTGKKLVARLKLTVK